MADWNGVSLPRDSLVRLKVDRYVEQLISILELDSGNLGNKDNRTAMKLSYAHSQLNPTGWKSADLVNGKADLTIPLSTEQQSGLRTAAQDIVASGQPLDHLTHHIQSNITCTCIAHISIHIIRIPISLESTRK